MAVKKIEVSFVSRSASDKAKPVRNLVEHCRGWRAQMHTPRQLRQETGVWQVNKLLHSLQAYGKNAWTAAPRCSDCVQRELAAADLGNRSRIRLTREKLGSEQICAWSPWSLHVSRLGLVSLDKTNAGQCGPSPSTHRFDLIYRRIPLASPGLIHAHFSDLVDLYTGWAYKRVGFEFAERPEPYTKVLKLWNKCQRCYDHEAFEQENYQKYNTSSQSQSPSAWWWRQKTGCYQEYIRTYYVLLLLSMQSQLADVPVIPCLRTRTAASMVHVMCALKRCRSCTTS